MRTTPGTEHPRTDVPPGQAQPEYNANTEDTSRTVEQTNHRLIRDALRETLQAGPSALEKAGSLRYRASAVLYLLLLEHPLDERGRCWSCPGVLRWLRPRPCQIHLKASDWLLHHPDEALSHLARELGAASLLSPNVLARRTPGTPPRSGLTVRARPDPRDTDVPPAAAGEPRPDPAQIPVHGAVPPSLAGWSVG